MNALTSQFGEALVRAVAFVDDGVCPSVGFCVLLYPLAAAAWGKSKTYERASMYTGGIVLALYAIAALATTETLNAGLALVIAIRAIIAAVAARLLAAIVAALAQTFALNPARRIALACECGCEQRRARRASQVDEARRRQREAEDHERNAERVRIERRSQEARNAEQARRHAAARAQNAARYEFQLRYVAARSRLSERISQAEFETLLQTTLEPTDPAELDNRKTALGQLLDALAQEAIAKEPPQSMEQLVADYQRRHDEIDASGVATDMKEKMHRWLNKEESQALARFMASRYD